MKGQRQHRFPTRQHSFWSFWCSPSSAALRSSRPGATPAGVVLFAVVSLVVVRVVAVVIALAGSGLSARHTLFIGWFGPRGMGTLILGLLVIDRGEIQHGPLIGQAVVITVTLSLLLHSITAPLGIRLCANGATPAAAQPDEKALA